MNTDQTQLVPAPATVVADYFTALAAGNFARVSDLVAPMVRWHQPGANQFSGTLTSRDAVFAMIASMGELTGGSFAVAPQGPLMTNGDLVAVDVHFTGQRDDKQLDMDGVDLHRVADGKLIEVWLFSADQPAEDDFWGDA